MDDSLGFRILKAVSITVLILAILIWGLDTSYQKKKEAEWWEQFKQEHKCLLIAQSFSGEVGYKEAWFCNNAIIYYR